MITMEHFVKFACEFITLEPISTQHYYAEGKNCTIHIGIKNATTEFLARKPFFSIWVSICFILKSIFLALIPIC